MIHLPINRASPLALLVGGAILLEACGGDDNPTLPPETRPTGTDQADEACEPANYDIVVTFYAKGLRYEHPWVNNATTPYEPLSQVCVDYQIDRVDVASSFMDAIHATDYKFAQWNSLPKFLDYHRQLCREEGAVSDEQLEECQTALRNTVARQMHEDLFAQCFHQGCWGNILGLLTVTGETEPLLPRETALLMGSGMFVQTDWEFSDNPYDRTNPDQPLTANLTLTFWSTNDREINRGDDGTLSEGFWAEMFDATNDCKPTAGRERTATDQETGEEVAVSIPDFSDGRPIAKRSEAFTGVVPNIPCLSEGESFRSADIPFCTGDSCGLLPGTHVDEMGIRLLITRRNIKN
ncbi:MAG: hypothetical protein HYT77_02545 [Deltaproteobacteria bacterium]|nr:hypothetical protein [Deltaproteobacteria bacterium]